MPCSRHAPRHLLKALRAYAAGLSARWNWEALVWEITYRPGLQPAEVVLRWPHAELCRDAVLTRLRKADAWQRQQRWRVWWHENFVAPGEALRAEKHRALTRANQAGLAVLHDALKRDMGWRSRAVGAGSNQRIGNQPRKVS